MTLHGVKITFHAKATKDDKRSDNRTRVDQDKDARGGDGEKQLTSAQRRSRARAEKFYKKNKKKDDAPDELDGADIRLQREQEKATKPADSRQATAPPPAAAPRTEPASGAGASANDGPTAMDADVPGDDQRKGEMGGGAAPPRSGKKGRGGSK